MNPYQLTIAIFAAWIANIIYIKIFVSSWDVKMGRLFSVLPIVTVVILLLLFVIRSFIHAWNFLG